MSSEFQTIAALAIVALTAAWFVARSLRRRRSSGCDAGCGCPTAKLKR